MVLYPDLEIMPCPRIGYTDIRRPLVRDRDGKLIGGRTPGVVVVATLRERSPAQPHTRNRLAIDDIVMAVKRDISHFYGTNEPTVTRTRPAAAFALTGLPRFNSPR